MPKTRCYINEMVFTNQVFKLTQKLLIFLKAWN